MEQEAFSSLGSVLVVDGEAASSMSFSLTGDVSEAAFVLLLGDCLRTVRNNG